MSAPEKGPNKTVMPVRKLVAPPEAALPARLAGVALMTSMRPPGYNAFSRLILEVPNPRALAEHIHSQGFSMSVILKNYVYMVMDPEGNQIEIFSRKPQAS